MSLVISMSGVVASDNICSDDNFISAYNGCCDNSVSKFKNIDYNGIVESNKILNNDSNYINRNEGFKDIISSYSSFNTNITSPNYFNNINYLSSSRVITVTTHTFEAIQNAIGSATDGDTILLENSTYIGNGTPLFCKSRLNFISNSGATLDAKSKSNILMYYPVNAGTIKFSNICFNNGVLDNEGSAIRLIQTLDKPVSLVMENCSFRNNVGGNDRLGAAVLVYDCVDVKVLSCNFMNNINKVPVWVASGAAIRIVSSNTSNHVLIHNCKFINNTNLEGSGIVKISSSASVTNCTFLDNFVGAAGVLQVGGSDNNTIKNCLFKNNTLQHHGAICLLGFALIKNCTFIDNYAKVYGGGICNHYSADIFDCNFYNNSAGRGGAITTGYDNTEGKWLVRINNCYFDGNSAEGDGGAVLARYIDIDNDFVVINNSVFINNSASYGGAINVVVNYCNCSNLTFINNSAILNGGAVFIEGYMTKLESVDCINNSAGFGAGIYINGSNTRIINSNLSNNHAIPLVDTPINDSHMDDGLGGGAFLNGDNIFISNVNLSNNTARNGSGFYLSGRNMNLDNVLDNSPNQAWSYLLPIEVTYNDGILNFKITHIGGNNINGGDKNGNFIYLNATNDNLIIDGRTPVDGVENSNDGTLLFKDNREQYQTLNWIISDNLNETINKGESITNLYGNINISLNASNLVLNSLYLLNVTHLGETYYTYINNFKYFTNSIPLVNKTTDEDIKFVNETFVYTIAVTNVADLDETFIVTEKLPINFIYQGDDAIDECILFDLDNHKISWNITVPAKTNYYINIWGFSNESNINLTNFVNVVNSLGFDVNATNEILIYSKADLVVNKLVNVTAPVSKGDNITWTINIINNGPNTAKDVTIFDLIDENLMRFINTSDNRYNKSSGKLYLGDLDKGDSFSFDIIVEILKSNLTITNIANVYSSSLNLDNDSINISVIQSVDVLPQANLVISQIVNNSNPLHIDDLIKFTINLTNLGPDLAEDVLVSDLFDCDVLSFISCNDSRFDLSDCSLYLGDLDSGDSFLFDIECEVIKSNTNFTNYVEAYTPILSPKGIPNNVSDSISLTVLPQANLEIYQEVNKSIVNVGEDIKITVTIVNNGPDNASNVVITNILNESNLKFAMSNDTRYQEGKLDLGDFDANSTFSFEIHAKTLKSNLNISNIANVYSPTYNLENIPNNKTSEIVIQVIPSAVLTVNKFVNKHKVKVGNMVIWTIVVMNHGPDDAESVFCIDKLPKGLKFISYNISLVNLDSNLSNNSSVFMNNYFESSYDFLTGKWLIGNLKSNYSIILNIISKAISSGNFTNFVSLYSETYNPNGAFVSDFNSVEVISDSVNNKTNDSDNVSKKSYGSNWYGLNMSYKTVDTFDNIDNGCKMLNTGNPILILLLILISLGFCSLRRKY